MLQSSSIPGSQITFWDMLKSFWSDDRIQKWRDAIFSNPENPDQGVETCSNLICLSRDAHKLWTDGYFAFEPTKLSDDKKCLDVKFHWIPRRCSTDRRPVSVDILSLPPSLEDLDGIRLYHFPTDQRIYSGRKFSLTTDDPVNHPLPHYELLEMQWILHRVAAMSGAANIYDDFDNDDDDPMALRNEWDQYEEDEWGSYMEDDDWNSYAEGSPPMLVNQPSSSSSPTQPSLSPLQKSNIRFDRIPLWSADVHQSSPPSSPPRQPSPSPLPKSSIRFDHIPLRPVQNPDITMIGSPQGQ
jgi:hypothetical protein